MRSSEPQQNVLQLGMRVRDGGGIVAEDTDVSVSRREIITVRGQSYVSRLPKY